MTKERPILFSTPMVRAILDGRKTMTRRVLNPQPENKALCDFYRQECLLKELKGYVANGLNSYHKETVWHKPRYSAGDVLWVREAYALAATIDSFLSGESIFAYKADFTDYGLKELSAAGLRWHPSIHMPRAAARLFLRVTDVGAERLREISVADAKAEGIAVWASGCIDGLAFGCYNGDECVYNRCERPIELFREIWDGINAKRGYGWDKNPYVWVYKFERTEKPQ
ncbi:MAG: hypothetical protein LBK23_02570 [Oscillospiraceae bacterium]|jgi:hypothetical protein|nr:hypothetical protein [Oscillospiraceae bacterium]